MSTTITAHQYDSLVKQFYLTLISAGDMGLGDMNECRDAAKFAVDTWIESEGINVTN